MKHLFQRKPKINEQNITMHLIDKQLAYVGKTWNDIKDDPEWFKNNQITRSQYNEWKEYSIKTIQKVYKFNKQQAEYEFSWFDLGYGLSIKK